jgi:hypothetical protein
LYPDPGGLALAQREEGAADGDHEGIAERSLLSYCHLFAGSEAEVQEAVAILARPFEPLDAEPLVQGDAR